MQSVALGGGAGLRIGEAIDAAIGVQDDRAGHHWSRQTSPADFIHAGHRHEPVAVEGILDVAACGDLRHLWIPYALYAPYAVMPRRFF